MALYNSYITISMEVKIELNRKCHTTKIKDLIIQGRNLNFKTRLNNGFYFFFQVSERAGILNPRI